MKEKKMAIIKSFNVFKTTVRAVESVYDITEENKNDVELYYGFKKSYTIKNVKNLREAYDYYKKNCEKIDRLIDVNGYLFLKIK